MQSLVFGLDLAFDKSKVLLALSFGVFDYLFLSHEIYKPRFLVTLFTTS